MNEKQIETIRPDFLGEAYNIWSKGSKRMD